jgi:hypothetical protein
MGNRRCRQRLVERARAVPLVGLGAGPGGVRGLRRSLRACGLATECEAVLPSPVRLTELDADYLRPAVCHVPRRLPGVIGDPRHADLRFQSKNSYVATLRPYARL